MKKRTPTRLASLLH